MSDRRGTRPSRRTKYDSPLQKLQQAVQRSGTRDVLDSLPVPSSFVFHKTREKGYDTVKLLLGDRNNPDGSKSQAWARVVSSIKRTDLQPPVLFYDQELTDDLKRTSQHPRSASSLLRKATKLCPPFCFLQHDPIDEATKVREMLCAIVLYLAAITEADTCAWHWDAFGENLILALRYIHSRDAYHLWRQEQKLAPLKPSESAANGEIARRGSQLNINNDQIRKSSMDEPPKATLAHSGEYPSGTLRSNGDNLAIRPNTSLAKLRRELGDQKFKLLGNIPSNFIRISRHAQGGSLFPYRMWIGKAKYDATGEIIDVFAYLDHEGAKKASLVFMSHDSDGLEQTYDVNLLRDGVDLIEPLEYLNTLKKESYKDDAKSARTAKLRSLICYYFFIAEHEGLIGDPKININEGFCKRLWTVCKELGDMNWTHSASRSRGKDGISQDGGLDDGISAHSSVQPETGMYRNVKELEGQDEGGAESSRIVRARMRSHLRSEINRSGSVVELGGRLQSQEILPRLLSNDPLGAEAFHKDASELELELRPLSQVSQECSDSSTGGNADMARASVGPGKLATMGASTTDVEMVHVGIFQGRTDLDGNRVLSATVGIGTGDYAPLTNVCSEANMSQREHSRDISVGARVSATRSIPAHEALHISTHDPSPVDAQDSSSKKCLPVSYSSPQSTPHRSRTSSIATNKTKTGRTISDAQLLGHVPRIAPAQVGGNRPPTPEGSVERDLRRETKRCGASGNVAQDAFPISDEECWDPALLLPKVPARPQRRMDIVDLTQTSPNPRGKKRRSSRVPCVVDSDDDTIAETDGSEWRRKSRGQRRR